MLKRNTLSKNSILEKMFMNAFLTATVIEFAHECAAFVDGLVTSRFLGADEMAAFGLCRPYYSIMGIISGCISVGMQTLCTKEIGRGRLDNLSRFFSEALISAIALSSVFTAVVLTFAEPFSIFLGAKGQAAYLLEPTKQFLLGLTYGTPFTVLEVVLATAISLDNGGRLVKISTIVGTIVNCVLDFWAVDVGLGIFGLGLSTSISRFASTLILLLNFFKKERILKFNPKGFAFTEVFRIIKYGSLKVVLSLVKITRSIVLNYLVISVGGGIAMTVMSIRGNLMDFGLVPILGMANAVALLSGIFYGEINKDDILTTGKIAHNMTVRIISVIALFFAVFARPIANFYLRNNPEAVDLLTFSLVCLAIYLLLDSLVNARISYLQATHKLRTARLLTTLVNLVYIVFFAFVMSKLFGIYGIMAAFPVSELAILITIQIKYIIKTKKGLPSPTDYLGLEKSFDIGPGDEINLSVRDMEEVSLLAEQISMFCRGHKFDKRRSNIAGLCAEEMTSNIVEHGFSEKNKVNEIDVRLVISEDDLVLRIRDHCVAFNPLQQIKLISEHENDDPTSNVGIRIVHKTAKDITYYRTLDTNTTIIKL